MRFSNLDSTSEEDLLWKEIEIKHAQLNIDQRKWRHFPAVADSDGAVISGAEKFTEPQGIIIRQATVRLGHNPLRGT